MYDTPLYDVLEWISLRSSRAEILSDNHHDLFRESAVCDSFSLQYSVHAPTADLNIASMIEKIRRTSIVVIADLVRVCEQINADFLVIHPGFNAWGSIGELTVQALHKSLSELQTIQNDTSIRLLVENMPPYDMYPFQSPAFCDIIRSYNLGFVLDIGHAHLTNNVPEFLDKSPEYLHIHDNNGRSDDHIAIGDGTIAIDISEFARRIPGVIEVRTQTDVDRSFQHLGSDVLLSPHPRLCIPSQ